MAAHKEVKKAADDAQMAASTVIRDGKADDENTTRVTDHGFRATWTAVSSRVTTHAYACTCGVYERKIVDMWI